MPPEAALTRALKKCRADGSRRETVDTPRTATRSSAAPSRASFLVADATARKAGSQEPQTLSCVSETLEGALPASSSANRGGH